MRHSDVFDIILRPSIYRLYDAEQQRERRRMVIRKSAPRHHLDNKQTFKKKRERTGKSNQKKNYEYWWVQDLENYPGKKKKNLWHTDLSLYTHTYTHIYILIQSSPKFPYLEKTTDYSAKSNPEIRFQCICRIIISPYLSIKLCYIIRLLAQVINHIVCTMLRF